ncbi:MAG TPA: DUF3027 domain-containing protein [Pseudolysinimonas sp.]|nr:DUF3027 domain-containing protein [Pseudolysinimonas sp.]
MTTTVEVARAALLEITPESNVGALVSEQTSDEGVSTIQFASTMLGYPDWFWTVSVAQLPDEEPTVLEAELLPGEGALIAPDWVPWADRLEDYKAAQAAIAAGELAAGGAGSADDDDDVDDDEHGDDDLGDDPDDGIDFELDDELALMPAAVGVDEQDQPDAEPDEDGPEPPAAPVRKQRAKKQQ